VSENVDHSAVPKPSILRRVFKVAGMVSLPPLVIGLVLLWIYGTNTHHSSRNTIWWTERGRSLIPPTATEITLQQDFLDHFVTYRITEAELNQFLNTRFAEPGEVKDSYKERSPVRPEKVGQPVGRLGWIVTEDTVEYFGYLGNGTSHFFYHDTKTGMTYQESAYW